MRGVSFTRDISILFVKLILNTRRRIAVVTVAFPAVCCLEHFQTYLWQLSPALSLSLLFARACTRHVLSARHV